MNFEVCTSDEIKTIVKGINDYNYSKVPPILSEMWTPINYVVKDSNQEILGGLLSGIGYWGGLEIKILWVREDMRQQGIASKLLKTVEDVAITKGATISILDTFDFQAEVFYLKNGYTIFGKLDDFPSGHHRVYLSKKLSND
ncbi:GNAT family N-acetyltransferase [Aquimarina sp. AU474]|uniref:GNAT family N-acetyltransferase n=1 Tax=Aquimarina sp. AU474 TaxID=2108529 RepID=UPI000D69D395|nr:GNAT family N-acetyltransferase [Aquimarina sp. AU474]